MTTESKGTEQEIVWVVLYDDSKDIVSDFEVNFHNNIDNDKIIECIFSFLHSYYRDNKGNPNYSKFSIKKVDLPNFDNKIYQITYFHETLGWNILCNIDNDYNIHRRFSKNAIGNIKTKKYRFNGHIIINH